MSKNQNDKVKKEGEKIQMNSKERIKILKDKGITLIALVITIIVLLILAGVSIAMLTGENGILTKAVDAGEKTKNTTEEEQVKCQMMFFVFSEITQMVNCLEVRKYQA